MIRKHCFYNGSVQGIGFRATAHDAARRHRINGWVKNLPDGRVELVAEGPTDAVHQFLQHLDERLGDYIHDTVMLDENPQDEGPFRIEH